MTMREGMVLRQNKVCSFLGVFVTLKPGLWKLQEPWGRWLELAGGDTLVAPTLLPAPSTTPPSVWG